MMGELLRFEHVSFAYEGSIKHCLALEECTVSIRSGERIAVLGGNGAGKSTFFLLAGGVLRPGQAGSSFGGSPWAADGGS